MKIPSFLAVPLAAAVLALGGCAAPADAPEGPEASAEPVASTSQALIVTPNCDDHGVYRYTCYARKPIGDLGIYVLLDVVNAWADDSFAVENRGTTPVRVAISQGFITAPGVELPPGAGMAVRAIDQLTPGYAITAELDAGQDPAGVRLELHKL